jgi:hypothetical protein
MQMPPGEPRTKGMVDAGWEPLLFEVAARGRESADV